MITQRQKKFETAPKPTDFPSLSSSSDHQKSVALIENWGAPATPTAAVAQPFARQQAPTKSDFPTLGEGSGGVTGSSSFFSTPALPSFTAPVKKQYHVSANGKIKPQKGKAAEQQRQQTKPLTSGLLISAAVKKAQKSQWWNEADNSVRFFE